MQTKHTPTPWFIRDAHPTRACLDIVDGEGRYAPSLATLYNAPGDKSSPEEDGVYRDDLERVANAEFIVRACNSHDKLVAALIRLLGATNQGNADTHEPGCMCVIHEALAALAAANAA